MIVVHPKFWFFSDAFFALDSSNMLLNKEAFLMFNYAAAKWAIYFLLREDCKLFEIFYNYLDLFRLGHFDFWHAETQLL